MSVVPVTHATGTADIDDLDRRIIYELQRDARHTSASDIAEECDVSPSTVRKRIRGLEEAGVLRGYHPDVDGVVAVGKVMAGSENLHVEVVGHDGDDPSRIG